MPLNIRHIAQPAALHHLRHPVLRQIKHHIGKTGGIGRVTIVYRARLNQNSAARRAGVQRAVAVKALQPAASRRPAVRRGHADRKHGRRSAR